MTVGGSSGTYGFDITLSDVVLEAYERVGIRNTPLTTEHLISARRSLNLVLSKWSNRGINLWKVNLVSTYMPQGQAVYNVDPATINVLDVYLRQYQMGAPVSVTPDVTTTAGSPTVTVGGFSSTPLAGGYVSIIVPIAIDGLVLQGFYQVVSVPSSSSATITASANAVAGVVSGGTVPSFTTTAGSADVTVTLANHGLLAGQTFNVQVATAVGGINLLGPYVVNAGPTTNTFTFTAANVAGSGATVSENGGLAQLACQAVIAGLTQNADPIDILLFPLSRNDYAAIPDKLVQGRPTSFWFNRTLQPNMNIWQVPDGNGPYELRYYAFTQIQDANATMGQTSDLPYRFFEAFCAGVAAHLAMKWATDPQKAIALNAYAEAMWTEAANADREIVPLYLSPDFSSYFR